MAEAFIGEIRAFGFNFAPRGWAICQGQILPISQNTALFSLLGTNFGGNGQSTFGLPNLEGRTPVGAGQAPGLSIRDLGEMGGQETVTLQLSEMPAHSHGLFGSSSPGSTVDPTGVLPAKPSRPGYTAAAQVTMGDGSVRPSGGGQPHNNNMPSLVINYCIALQGIFPPRT